MSATGHCAMLHDATVGSLAEVVASAFGRLTSARVVARPMPDLPKGPARRARELEEGRACAAEALAALGAASTVVGTQEDRAPAWPEGFVGSLTHTHAFVAAAVARANDVRGLGIDAEQTMSAETIAEVAEEIASERERQLIGGEPAAFTALFSAKESLFKCVYPLERVWFDFEDAAVTGVGDGVLALSLVRDVGMLVRGTTFEARWSLVDGHVLTVVEVRR